MEIILTIIVLLIGLSAALYVLIGCGSWPHSAIIIILIIAWVFYWVSFIRYVGKGNKK